LRSERFCCGLDDGHVKPVHLVDDSSADDNFVVCEEEDGFVVHEGDNARAT
jgi:hypothetical protein